MLGLLVLAGLALVVLMLGISILILRKVRDTRKYQIKVQKQGHLPISKRLVNHGSNFTNFQDGLPRELDVLLLRDGPGEPSATVTSYDVINFSADGNAERVALQKVVVDSTYNKPITQQRELNVMCVRLCMMVNNMQLRDGTTALTPLPPYFAENTTVLYANLMGRREAFAYFIVSPLAPECPVVVFRGTTSTRDWLQDLKMRLIQMKTVTQITSSDPRLYQGRVHRGFMELYYAMHTSLKNIINSHARATGVGYKTMLICGHSLGAALATLCAYDLRLWSQQQIDLTVYLFGSPRVGDAAFCDTYNTMVPRTLRFANSEDGVCDVPSERLGYQHVMRDCTFSVFPRSLNIPSDNSGHSLLCYLFYVQPDAPELITIDECMSKMYTGARRTGGLADQGDAIWDSESDSDLEY